MTRSQEFAQWFTNERAKALEVSCRACGQGVGEVCTNRVTGLVSERQPACASRILDAEAVNG